MRACRSNEELGENRAVSAQLNDPRRVALPLAVTLAVQMLVAFAVYCAPVMAPVASYR